MQPANAIFLNSSTERVIASKAKDFNSVRISLLLKYKPVRDLNLRLEAAIYSTVKA